MTIPSSPKNFRSEFADRSPKHDDIHLWLNEEIVQEKLVKACYSFYDNNNNNNKNRKDFHFDKITKYEIEKPIYGYNNFLLGIVDALIGFNITDNAPPDAYKCRHCYHISKYNNKDNNDGEGEGEGDYPDSINCQNPHCLPDYYDRYRADRLKSYKQLFVICEFKPELKNVGATLAQIKVYRDTLPNSMQFREKYYINKDEIIPVIITLDDNYTKYIRMLNAQGVQIFKMVESNLDDLFWGNK